MNLRGIEFGSVLGASGVQGFFGEGYVYHRLAGPLRPNFEGVTFVAKTATLLARSGNMHLNPDYTPSELFPGCVQVRPISGVALNAVGLSNPGLSALLATGRWQERSGPYWLSFMSLADTAEQRLDEMRKMVDILGQAKSELGSEWGLQLNLSCPNTGHDPAELIQESSKVLDIAGQLKVPLMPKYSIATAPIAAVMELNDHPECDAICVSNTLPWGWSGVDWQKVWGGKVSPLADLGGGGLSGSALTELVCDYIAELRQAGFGLPINGGGGIMHRRDVDAFKEAGSSSVFIGTVAMLRPWRVQGIVEWANSLEWRQGMHNG